MKEMEREGGGKERVMVVLIDRRKRYCRFYFLIFFVYLELFFIYGKK